MDHPGCCAPSRSEPPLSTPVVGSIGPTDGPERPRAGVQEAIALPGGEFAMGDGFGEGYGSDGEVPMHSVRLSSFAVDPTAVTNAEFVEFVDDTGHVTDAEQFGSSAVFHLAVRAAPAEVLGRAAGAPWWLDVRGADWRRPDGQARVMRGGSYLCHASYCHRYRVAARSSNTPESSAANLGLRCAR